MDDSAQDKPCKCGVPEAWAQMPDHPVRFDPRLNEYSIDTADMQYIMRYCPRCGGKLPKSRRGELFMAIDPIEQEESLKLMEGIRTGKQALQELGPPTHVFDWVDDPRLPPSPKAVRWAKQYTYASRFRTFELLILLDGNDAIVNVSLSAKRKEEAQLPPDLRERPSTS